MWEKILARSHFQGKVKRNMSHFCVSIVFIVISIFYLAVPLANADPNSTDQPADRWYFTNPQASPCGIFPSILQNSGFDVTDATLVNSENFVEAMQDDPHVSSYESAYLNAMHQLFSDQNDSSICSWRSRTNPQGDNLQVVVFHWSGSDGPGEADALRIAEMNVMKVINCQTQLREIRRELADRERRKYTAGRQQAFDRFHIRDDMGSAKNSISPVSHKPDFQRPIICTPQGPMFVEQNNGKKQYTPVHFHLPRLSPHDHRPQSQERLVWPIEDFTRPIFDIPVHFSSGIYGCTASSDLGLFVMATGYRCDKLANMLVKVVQP